jgi:hypothetical protein
VVRVNGERLIPVKSFDELRVGMILVAKGCCKCDGGTHRFMLLNYVKQKPFWDGFAFDPVPMCFPPHDAKWVIAPTDVATGRLFRVDDDLEHLDRLEASAPKPRKLARTR